MLTCKFISLLVGNSLLTVEEIGVSYSVIEMHYIFFCWRKNLEFFEIQIHGRRAKVWWLSWGLVLCAQVCACACELQIRLYDQKVKVFEQKLNPKVIWFVLHS